MAGINGINGKKRGKYPKCKGSATKTLIVSWMTSFVLNILKAAAFSCSVAQKVSLTLTIHAQAQALYAVCEG